MSQLALTPHGRRQLKPVFQDLSLRRWYGFLVLVGSAAATAVFLTAILWYSVHTTPELPLLEPYSANTAGFTPAQSPLAPSVAEPQRVGPRTPSSPVNSSITDAGLSLALEAVPKENVAPPSGGRSGHAAVEHVAFASGSFVVLGGGAGVGSTVYIGRTADGGRPERTP